MINESGTSGGQDGIDIRLGRDTESEIHLFDSKEMPAGYEQIQERETEIPVFFIGGTLPKIRGHLDQDWIHERGGLLIGEAYSDPAGKRVWVEVVEAVPARSRGTEVRVPIRPEDFDNTARTIDERFPGRRIVGWYHSHPGHGIFLSPDDEYIQNNFFSQRNGLAYVYDPRTRASGLFTSDNHGRITQLRGFYGKSAQPEPIKIEKSDLDERPIKITWRDYLAARWQKFIDKERREAERDRQRTAQDLQRLKKDYDRVKEIFKGKFGW